MHKNQSHKEEYYSVSLLKNLAYNDDVNGNCDGMIDFTVLTSITPAKNIFKAPYDYGTFVKTNDRSGVTIRGTVSAYTVTESGYLIWVSGYNTPCCAECLPEEVELMSKHEIAAMLKEEVKYD